jgi:hypothetical protein
MRPTLLAISTAALFKLSVTALRTVLDADVCLVEVEDALEKYFLLKKDTSHTHLRVRMVEQMSSVHMVAEMHALRTMPYS